MEQQAVNFILPADETTLGFGHHLAQLLCQLGVGTVGAGEAGLGLEPEALPGQLPAVCPPQHGGVQAGRPACGKARPLAGADHPIPIHPSAGVRHRDAQRGVTCGNLHRPRFQRSPVRASRVVFTQFE